MNLDLTDKRVLLITDIHQDIKWVEKILNKEEYDHVIFGGDWFDSFKRYPEVFTPRNTAKWLHNFMETHENATYLIGNHDLAYYETSHHSRDYKKKHHINYICSGYTNNKSIEINKELTDEDWKEFEPFVLLNDKWLISHAGIRSELITPYFDGSKTIDDLEKYQLEKLYNEGVESLNDCHILFNPIFGAGRDRGGLQLVGGITWLDWGNFENSFKFNQIVGHTTMYEYVREKNGSYCIDAEQTYYGIIERDNTFNYKNIYE